MPGNAFWGTSLIFTPHLRAYTNMTFTGLQSYPREAGHLLELLEALSLCARYRPGSLKSQEFVRMERVAKHRLLSVHVLKVHA